MESRKEPVAELEPQFSNDNATPTPWEEAREQLATAKVYLDPVVEGDAARPGSSDWPMRTPRSTTSFFASRCGTAPFTGKGVRARSWCTS